MKPVIAYCGCIPSMMYSENQNGDFSPTLKFQSYKFRAGKAKKSFLHFADEVMSGKFVEYEHSDIRCFYS